MKIILVLSILFVSISNAQAITEKAVLEHYADLAHAMYKDSLYTAKALKKSVELLVEEPTENHLYEAQKSWKLARIPYLQTEAYRFGNAIVDGWEGKVNAWPLDEGLIDYVASSYGEKSADNPLYKANVIANTQLILSGAVIDTSNITTTLLANTLHEVDGIEANVATGYHAIEFLLWGQDLNGTSAGAGNRLSSDFDVSNCTALNCARRAEYLLTVTQLLIDDLAWMTQQWTTTGEARTTLLKDESLGIKTIFTGLGSLSYGELAGERIKLGLMLHDPEEEQDCFSDNTHNAHYYNIKGMQNIYTGRYKTIKGKTLKGPSVSKLVAAVDKRIDKSLRKKIKATLKSAKVLVKSAEKHGIAYDQLLAEGNEAGNQKILNVVDALLAQTKAIELATHTIGLTNTEFAGSDSLDSPNAVFQ